MATEELDGPSWAGVTAAAIGAITAVVYMLAARSQVDLEATDPAALSVFFGILGFSALALFGAFMRERGRRSRYLLGSSLGLLVMGFIGIFSVGLPLLVAGLLVLVDGWRLRPDEEEPR